MKIVALLGSPRGKKGNTGRLLDVVAAAAREKGAQIEIVALKGDSVRPCRACDACHKEGTCPQKDDFEEIKSKIMAADGLLLASPNYIFNVSAQLKAFMDRCCGVVHCMGFEGKYGGAVVTSGGGDEEPIAQYMNHFLITTGIRPVGAVWATMGVVTGDDFPADVLINAKKLGALLVESIRNKTKFPDVERQMSAFRDRMKTLMQYAGDEWPYEKAHWGL